MKHQSRNKTKEISLKKKLKMWSVKYRSNYEKKITVFKYKPKHEMRQ